MLQQNAAANIIKGLEETLAATLEDPHPRWWEFALQPPTPSPANVKYQCSAALGSPSVGNCEAALYQFVRAETFVSFDPANGPTIVSSGMSCYSLQSTYHSLTSAGNCAIAIGYNQKATTTWDMLRGVAEMLLATCISNVGPLSGPIGGTAISQAISSKRRRQASKSFS